MKLKNIIEIIAEDKAEMIKACPAPTQDLE